ncbi:aspartate kinase [Actinomycetospora lutea]|uniref:aspartate kinase n=1 Tax=Actinomycetospora lutea TaxID=663604 RepID=UPI002366B240|nr:aspartate kinase [Actinomycetospora lutea]MDD7939425.1 aspartate kinase [Actinomycetospora lutea]
MTAPQARQQPTPPLVWKFGGTSVGDHDRIRAVARRIVAAHQAGHRVVAVLSAMGRTTDQLVAQAHELSASPDPREMDALLAVGERISCALTAMAITELGVPAISLDGAQAGVATDDGHGHARLADIDPRRIHAELDRGAIVLVTGFQGVTCSGDVSTLGRGGSDASAVALAAALGTSRCDIFTDVPAVFTADPRVVPDARPLTSVRTEEMLEMAEAGAGVLQPRAVELAAVHGVEIHLRSSFDSGNGTVVGSRPDPSAELERVAVAGVGHRRAEPLYAAPGASAGAVTSALARRGLALGATLLEASEVRFTVQDAAPAAVTAALEAAGLAVVVREELGTVGVVCSGLTRRPEIAASALDVLAAAGIEPRIVTTSPARITVHVAAAAVDDALRVLHAALVTDAAGAPTVPADPAAPALDSGTRPDLRVVA